jgi:hypothetical protein
LIPISGGEIVLDMPFFMNNDSWFYFDGEKFALTAEAPPEARESLDEFYREEEAILNGGKDHELQA